MKRYILIQNDGEIESNSFELIGASTKRGEAGKIGFFGSGLKYSIAYMMRNSIDFKVFSGETQLHFTSIQEPLKDKTFERICINGKPTSYTTTMGPTWTQDWFVLREIYCNAIDEVGCVMVKDTDNIAPISGKTRIYIELTPTLNEVIRDWDIYFSEERTPVYETNGDTSSIGMGDGQVSYIQPIKIFSHAGGNIYRRGVNVYSNSNLQYDYELQFCDVNEDRTAKNTYHLSYMFNNMMAAMCNESWVKSVLNQYKEKEYSYEFSSLRAGYTDRATFSKEWLEFSNKNLLVLMEVAGRYEEKMSKSVKPVYLLPSAFAKRMKYQLPDVNILGLSSTVNGQGLSFCEKTPKIDFLLNQVLCSLKEMKYEIPFDIDIVEFEDAETLGKADVEKKKIYMGKKTFDLGRREIAMTLMEENEHIISGKQDETRGFQTHLLSGWLKAMEESSSLFL